MKTIRLLSEIAKAANADITALRDFIACEIAEEDIDAVTPPSILSDHAIKVMDTDYCTNNAMPPEQIQQLATRADQALLAANWMSRNGVDFFVDDLVTFTECYHLNH